MVIGRYIWYIYIYIVRRVYRVRADEVGDRSASLPLRQEMSTGLEPEDRLLGIIVRSPGSRGL